MQALQKKVEDAEEEVRAAQANVNYGIRTGMMDKRWQPALQSAKAKLEEARNNLNAGTESQPQLIERRKQELAKAEAALAKIRRAPRGVAAAAIDEAEKAVAIAEYNLAQASKPAAAAAAVFGGKSRKRQGRGKRKTQRRKAKRLSSYAA